MARQSEKRARRGGAALRRSQNQQKQQSRPITRNIPFYEPWNEESLSIIERNAETVLQEIGVEFQGDDEILAVLQAGGAEVSGTRVRFARGLCRSLLKTAPAQFLFHGRNQERSVLIGGKNIAFAPVYGPPFIRNLEEGRRYATLNDFANFVKLTYASPHLNLSGGTVCEPVDIAVSKRHLSMVYSHIKYSDKPFFGSVTAPERAADSIAMARLVFGDSFVAENCVIMGLINVNSPLTFDAAMLGALKTYARAGQGVLLTPFILAGAMSPVSPAAVLTQILAEALAGMSLVQLLRPGAPVVFGSFAAATSMQSGAPMFGGPESALILLGAGQLARRLAIPYRSGGGLTGGKSANAQAGYESANTLYFSLLGGVNLMLHSAGWLEGGLVSSYEKFMIDDDQLGGLIKFAKGCDASIDAQAMEAIGEVGPGGHFLGCAHTQAHYKTAFCDFTLSNNNSFEQWKAEGERDTEQMAHQSWKRRLEEYQPPAIAPALDEALKDFIARKEREYPDSFA